jgi:hypothetical protein
MKKGLVITIAVLLVIFSASYFYIRFHVLKTKDVKPDQSKARNITDLRPAIIAKLQQLVKDGSDGLYVLSIEQISPDVITSKVAVTNASIKIDSNGLKRLDSLKRLPDDLFTFKFNSLHLDGFGIADLLDRNDMTVSAIFLNDPVIETYHRSRPYNKDEEGKEDSLTLYQRLSKVIKKISIGKINIQHGTFISHDLDHQNNISSYNNIMISMQNILIDSSTQYDKGRYLFAKHTTMRVENYHVLTANKNYEFKAAVIEVSGEQHRMIAENVEFIPNGGIKVLVSKMPDRRTVYSIKMPRMILNKVHWWSMINRRKFKSEEAELISPVVIAYSDYSKPPPVIQKKDNYPHQLLLGIPSPVSVDHLKIKDMKVIYEEYDPKVSQTTKVDLDHINGTIEHISNIPAEIKQHPSAIFTSEGLFMNKVPTRGKIIFNLHDKTSGSFSADFSMDTLNKEIVNPLAEPMALFTVKRGQMQHGSIHIEGNNSTAKAKITMYYTDMHVTPLKADSNSSGKLKKKDLKSFIANAFIIKNSNPGKGELRQPDISLTRDIHGSFFKMIWQCIMAGMIKTTGLPVKRFYKNAE